jgi:beta-galactosidase
MNNPRLIGDFVWAGIDYIGEVGVGSWTVDEYCNSDFSHLLNWILAGSGRIDITGKLTSEVDYTRVCFDLDVINIGVIPVHHYKNKHSSSSWKFSRCEKSWTYHGYENKETEVEVYAKGHHVELYLNDKLIGKQTFKDIPRYVFKVKYNPGILKAVVYDKLNNILGKSELNTSYDEPKLILKPEIYSFNKEDLIYVRAYLGDENSVHTYLRDIISIDMIENGELLGFANACSYYEDDYKSSKSDTFYGECLMIIRPNHQGDVLIKCSSSYGTNECTINMINND